MHVIYKYFIEEEYDHEKHNYYYHVKLPKGANVISAIDVNADPDLEGTIYAIVDPKEKEMVDRKIFLFGTGWPINDVDFCDINIHSIFLGTFRDVNGCVWHLWIQDEKIDALEVFSKLLC